MPKVKKVVVVLIIAVGLVLSFITLIHLGIIKRIRVAKPKVAATQPQPQINRDSLNRANRLRLMIERGYRPIELRNDWSDSAMIIIPGGIASQETTVFETSGQETKIFCQLGRHTATMLMKKKDEWVREEQRFTVSAEPMSGKGWSPTWGLPNRPSYGWVMTYVKTPQETIEKK